MGRRISAKRHGDRYGRSSFGAVAHELSPSTPENVSRVTESIQARYTPEPTPWHADDVVKFRKQACLRIVDEGLLWGVGLGAEMMSS
jgi:hypothetical protein